jgi:hypothetical protein
MDTSARETSCRSASSRRAEQPAERLPSTAPNPLKVANGSLTANDFAAGQLMAGRQGAAGPTGATGAAGERGPSSPAGLTAIAAIPGPPGRRGIAAMSLLSAALATAEMTSRDLYRCA